MAEDKAHALTVFTLQYRVTGSLDGITPAPEFSEGVYSGENLLDFEVENLGLLDLTLGRDIGQIADRLARWLYIFAPDVNSTTQVAKIVFDGGPVETVLVVPLGSRGVYDQQCILVPHSGQLGLEGWNAMPGVPIIVRLKVWIPTDIATLAEMQRYCCCAGTNLPPTILACERTVLTIDPSVIVTGGVQVVGVTITGSNFQANDQVVIMNTTVPPEVLVITNVVIVNSTTITADINLDGTEPLGQYDIIVGPEDFPACAGVLEDGLTLS